MYYVYLLKSLKDGRYYIGQTQDLQVRLEYHNSGRSTYTRDRGPWEWLAFKEFETRGEGDKRGTSVKEAEEPRSYTGRIRIEIFIEITNFRERPGPSRFSGRQGFSRFSGLGVQEACLIN